MILTLGSLTVAAFAVAGLRSFYHSIRFNRLVHGVVRYAFALLVNVIAILILMRIISGAIDFSLEHIEPWRHVYNVLVMRWVTLDPSSCNCEASENASTLLMLALTCVIATPLVWMVTKRFRVSTL